MSTKVNPNGRQNQQPSCTRCFGRSQQQQRRRQVEQEDKEKQYLDKNLGVWWPQKWMKLDELWTLFLDDRMEEPDEYAKTDAYLWKKEINNVEQEEKYNGKTDPTLILDFVLYKELRIESMGAMYGEHTGDIDREEMEEINKERDERREQKKAMYIKIKNPTFSESRIKAEIAKEKEKQERDANIHKEEREREDLDRYVAEMKILEKKIKDLEKNNSRAKRGGKRRKSRRKRRKSRKSRKSKKRNGRHKTRGRKKRRRTRRRR